MFLQSFKKKFQKILSLQVQLGVGQNSRGRSLDQLQHPQGFPPSLPEGFGFRNGGMNTKNKCTYVRTYARAFYTSAHPHICAMAAVWTNEWHKSDNRSLEINFPLRLHTHRCPFPPPPPFFHAEKFEKAASRSELCSCHTICGDACGNYRPDARTPHCPGSGSGSDRREGLA